MRKRQVLGKKQAGRLLTHDEERFLNKLKLKNINRILQTESVPFFFTGPTEIQ